MTASPANVERVKTETDHHSYLVTYNQPDIKIVIVFVHGIFGDFEETWQATPAQLMTSRALSQADWGSFGHATRLIDFGKAGNVIDQFILWAKTRSHLTNGRRRTQHPRRHLDRSTLASTRSDSRRAPPRQPGTTLSSAPCAHAAAAVGRTGSHFNRRLHEAPVYGFGFQFRMTVMGAAASLVTVFVRKRWPSRVTA